MTGGTRRQHQLARDALAVAFLEQGGEALRISSRGEGRLLAGDFHHALSEQILALERLHRASSR
jgi:hypothetical protein